MDNDPPIMLRYQEKDKKDKYQDICLERHIHCCPLVYSVEGIPGKDDDDAKHIKTILYYKWSCLYSQIAHYI